jgi:hypothetical protein
MIALEHRDEQRQGQEGVRAQFEEPDVVVPGQRLPFGVLEGQPATFLRGRAVQ